MTDSGLDSASSSESPDRLLEQSLEQSSPTKPDVRALMTAIRDRVKAAVDKPDQPLPFPRYQPQFSGVSRPAGELLHSEDLRSLNTHYAKGITLNPDHVETHRSGIVGRVIVFVKRKIRALIWDLIRDHVVAERNFQSHLIRFLNDISKYVDARDASNFWELIRKIDVDVTKALDRVERLGDDLRVNLLDTERRVGQLVNSDLGSLRSSAADQEQRLKTLDTVVSGIEGLLVRTSSGPSTSVPSPISGALSQSTLPMEDVSYLLLENRFRGSQAEIAQRVAIYPGIIKGCLGDSISETALPILEIGSGRGELQSLFRSSGMSSYGVDLDRGMNDVALSLGLDVRLEDGLSHLENLPAASLSGVIAVQVVEHLTFVQLRRLFALCASKVRDRGIIIFETINPRSLLALSSNYFRDPTHIWPLHPDTLAYEMSLAGLTIAEVKMLSPVSPDSQLREVPLDEQLTPKQSHLIQGINGSIRQLNQLLYGHQDYCIIAHCDHSKLDRFTESLPQDR